MEKKTDCICRRTIDKSGENWEMISFNDFGLQYSQDFIDAKKKEKITSGRKFVHNNDNVKENVRICTWQPSNRPFKRGVPINT